MNQFKIIFERISPDFNTPALPSDIQYLTIGKIYSKVHTIAISLIDAEKLKTKMNLNL